MYPIVIPKIPNTAGITGGAGIGNFTAANNKPVRNPVTSESNVSVINCVILITSYCVIFLM